MGPSLSNPFLSRELAAIDALLAVAESPSAHPRERRLAATKVLDICERLRADPSSSDGAPGFRPASAAAAELPVHQPAVTTASHPQPAATAPTPQAPSTRVPQRPTPSPTPATSPPSAAASSAPALPTTRAATSSSPNPDRTHTDDPYFTLLTAVPQSTPALPAASITTPAASRPTPELPRAA